MRRASDAQAPPPHPPRQHRHDRGRLPPPAPLRRRGRARRGRGAVVSLRAFRQRHRRGQAHASPAAVQRRARGPETLMERVVLETGAIGIFAKMKQERRAPGLRSKAPPRARMSSRSGARGFTLGGHRLLSLYRAPTLGRAWLMEPQPAPSSWPKYLTGAWGCETPTPTLATGATP